VQLRQPFGQGGLIGLSSRGQRFPFLLLQPRGLQLGLRLRQLLRQLRIAAGRRLGGLKRAAAELRIAKGAVKPHPQLPGHAQDLQRRGVIAVQIVIGEIALAAQAMEQLRHLPLQHAIALQAPQQLLLRFVLPQLHPKA
jgi:hypothetical protein